MTQVKSEFLAQVGARGLMHQATDLAALDAALMAGVVPAYIGFDATADSLHVGSLVQIMILRRLQQAGHKPIVLMGGGTTKVGDPSGKDEARKLLSNEQIDANIAGIRRVFEKFLRFGGGATDAIMVNNADWLDRLEYIPFLRDVGRHFSVNRMLSMDSVKLRLEREQPLSFLEFNYMVLQAYDFVELARRHGCLMQMGGSDQWGNIVSGVDLGRRVLGKELFGLTTPLLATASGAKMGKTAAGAVWLNEDKLSAYDYFQYWRNTEDADVGRFLRLFTDLPIAEIERLEALAGAEINAAKKVLAYEATRMAHGRAAADAAADTAQKTFEAGGLGEANTTVTIAASAFAREPIYRVLTSVGVTSSNAEARRLIEQAALRIGDRVVDDPAKPFVHYIAQPAANTPFKVSRGKKQVYAFYVQTPAT